MSELRFRCSGCARELTADPAIWRCPECRSPLEVIDRQSFDPSMIDHARTGFWRYHRSFPFDIEHPVTLGEPVTPLIPATIGGLSVLAKLEGVLPTGSFKDRGMAVLVSWLRERGVTHAVEDSSGNAAASIAGYAARAGIGCTVFAPANASPGKLVQAAAFGATVMPIAGSRDDVAHAAEIAALEPGGAYATHNWHPLFVEGVKTWAFEVWEQLGFEFPDAIIAPAGSGSVILGAMHAFGELGGRPRLYAAQAAACAPLVAALRAGSDDTAPFERRASVAEGIMIANPVRGRAILTALRNSGGDAIAVDESDIADALFDAAHQGIYSEPTSATAWAAASHLIERGKIGVNERVVIVLTGNGLKTTQTIGNLL